MTVVLFAPFARIEKHAALERHIAYRLRESGNDVQLITCATQLRNRCTAMESVNLDPAASDGQKSQVCRKCLGIQSRLDNHAPYRTTSMDQLLVGRFADLAETIRLEFHRSSGPDFVWDGHPLGRIWAYETILRFKSETALNGEGRNHYHQFAASGATAFAAAKALLAQESLLPDALFVYSGQYGINRSFCLPFLDAGVPCFNFTNAGQLSDYAPGFRVSAMDSRGRIDNVSLRTVQNLAAQRPLEDGEARSVTHWLADRIGQKGDHVYSQPRSRLNPDRIRDRLDVGRKQCVIVLTSSPDEALAADYSDTRVTGIAGKYGDVNFSQYVLLELVVEIARMAPDIQFIVRLHPRLAPNHRESATSPHLFRLMRVLSDAPENVVVNEPNQKMSLYDLAMIADCGINGYSTAGTELLALGIPVVGILGAHDDNIMDRSIEVVAPRADEVLEALRRRIGTPLSMSELATVYRQIVAATSRVVVPVRGENEASPGWRGLRNGLVARRFWFGRWGDAAHRTTLSYGRSVKAASRDWMSLVSEWKSWGAAGHPKSLDEQVEVESILAWLADRLEPWDGNEGVLGQLLAARSRFGSFPAEGR